MKIILTKDITALGNLGAVVDVAKGYARNYLIPQGLAMEATKGALARVEQMKAKYAQVQAKEQETAQAKVATLEGVSVTIAQRVGEEERLYGSVTSGHDRRGPGGPGPRPRPQATGTGGAHQTTGHLPGRRAPGPGSQGHHHRGRGGRIAV